MNDVSKLPKFSQEMKQMIEGEKEGVFKTRGDVSCEINR